MSTRPALRDQQRQQPVLDRRQVHGSPPRFTRARRQVDLDVAEANTGSRPRRRGALRRRSAARMRASSSPTPKGLVR